MCELARDEELERERPQTKARVDKAKSILKQDVHYHTTMMGHKYYCHYHLFVRHPLWVDLSPNRVPFIRLFYIVDCMTHFASGEQRTERKDGKVMQDRTPVE